MSNETLSTKVHDLRELNRMAAELEAEIEAIKDEIKAHMTEIGTDALEGSDFRITWQPVSSTRIDTKKLAADFPDIYSAYGITSTVRRFTLK